MSSDAYVHVAARQQSLAEGGFPGSYADPIDTHAKVLHAADGVTAMAVSGASVWLALANGGMEVRDAHSGAVRHTFTAPVFRRPSDNTRIWCLLAVYDESDEDLLRGMRGSGGGAATLAALSGTPRGVPQVWVGLSSGAVEVYHGQTYTLLRQLRKHLSGVYCLTADQSSGVLLGDRDRAVYSGSSDFQIAQWRVRDGGLLRVFTGHTNYVRCLYAEGAALISGSDDGTVRVWDRGSGETLHTGTFHIHANTAAGSSPPDAVSRPAQRQRSGVSVLCRVGVSMWSGDESGSLVVWRLSDCTAVLVSRPHTARIVALRKVGSLVYSSAADSTICVYSALDGTLARRLLMAGTHPAGGGPASPAASTHHGARVTALQGVVEVSRHFLWTAATDNTVRCWHHDDHLPMTDDRERFHDMRWYYTSTQPFLAANEALLEEQRELTELVVLSSGSDEAVRAYLAKSDGESQSVAAQYWQLEAALRDAQARVRQDEEARRELEATLAERRRVLEVARANLQRMSEEQRALRAAAGGALAPPPVAGTSAETATVPLPAPVGSTGLAAAPTGLPAPTTTTAIATAATLAGPPSLTPAPVAAPPLPVPPLMPSAVAVPAPVGSVAAVAPVSTAALSTVPVPVAPTTVAGMAGTALAPAGSPPPLPGSAEPRAVLSASYEPDLRSLPPPPPPLTKRPSMALTTSTAVAGASPPPPPPSASPPVPPPPPAQVPLAVPPPPPAQVPLAVPPPPPAQVPLAVPPPPPAVSTGVGLVVPPPPSAVVPQRPAGV